MSDATTPRRAAVYGRESKDNTRSVEDQVTTGLDVIAGQGWTHTGSYDDGTSASRYATKARPGWERLLVDLETDAFDVLVLWETTRGSREPIGWFTLLNACRERGILLHVVSDERTYDPRRARDYKDLASAGVDGAYEVDRTSERVQRGVARSARGARPAMGRPPYGYRRCYDPATGKLAGEYVTDADGTKRWQGGQEPDPATAPVVRDIFEQVAKLVPVAAIAKRLNAEGVAPPGAAAYWHRSRIRDLASNPAYIGLRRHRRYGRNASASPATYPAKWEPIVDEEVFYAAQRVLAAPGRRTNGNARPGRQTHLLSYLAQCYRGHPLKAKRGRYTCAAGCINVDQVELDVLVEALILEALADPKVYARLRQRGELADREIVAARNESAKLGARLKEWRQAGRRGEVTPESLAEIEAGLSADIAAANRRADDAGLPPALRPFAEPGADIEARWDDATVPGRREVIRALSTVTVQAVGGRPGVPVAERVDIVPR